MRSLQHFVPNGDGWHMALQQTWDPDKLLRPSRPVLIVPGYGMNSYIFGYHPRGVSLEGALAAAGLEVWRVDLRAQGDSRSIGGDDRFGLEELAVTDLSAAIHAVVDRSHTGAEKADLIGASLGGSIAFAHVALVDDHRVGALVAVGAPVRWVKVHPLVRAAFGSPTLAGLVRFKGTRKLAGAALPLVLKRMPWLLSIYMSPGQIDHGALDELVKTVEDPNRWINKQIAQWIREGDLVVRGRNVARELRRLQMPLLCVVANGDGIVPPETARFSYDQVASEDRTLLVVGDEELSLAHADMFISDQAHDRVFAPVRDWLVRRAGGR
jgi:pimeloyl-ACP methyl ester carboxylesterase